MPIRIEKDKYCWTIIHSRAHARNAIDAEHAEALYQAFIQFENDSQARVAVLWGEGGAFCAGYDLKQAAAQAGQDLPSQHAFPNSDAHSKAPMGPSRLQLTKPVIAAIAGPAVAGGMELAIWADIRVMEHSAYMGVFCRRWGVPLIDGGTVRLPRLIGQGRALDLILTGRRVDATEAHRIGLCEYLVEEGQSRAEAERLAQQIANFPQNCLRSDRQSVYSQHALSLSEALRNEWQINQDVLQEGTRGAARFVAGKGRSGDFDDI